MGYYRYNGVTLDALPEWDEAAYPNAYIMESSLGSGTYALHVSASKLHLNASDYGEMMWEIDASPRLIYSFDTSTWNESISTSQGAYEIDRLLWTNYDILGDDGETVLFAASDPVPVEEDEPKRISLDPTALLMGWMVGKRMAGMRKSGNETPKEPIAYLYPSVVLPDIESVWTGEVKEQFPYAIIKDSSSESYMELVLTTFPVYTSPEGYLMPLERVDGTVTQVGDYQMYSIDLEYLEDGWSFDENGYDSVIGAPSEAIWTSHDICNLNENVTPDGTTYLKAFAPVSAGNGMVCYKGAVLPDINQVWTDKSAYPYAVIVHETAQNFYALSVSNQPWYRQFTYAETYNEGEGVTFIFSSLADKAAWEPFPVFMFSLEDGDNYTTIWANADVTDYDDGTTYLAASEPVAVYE